MTQPTVLIVDDEDDIREVARMALEVIGGWITHTASSGDEARQLAATIRPDVVLLDVMMPGLDGPATLARLRDDPATRTIPVVFLTAKTQASDLVALEALGARGVLSKPFDPLTLADSIADLMEWRR